jgi:hypothetical protein
MLPAAASTALSRAAILTIVPITVGVLSKVSMCVDLDGQPAMVSQEASIPPGP